jgi:putative acetyltransferase
MNIRYETVADIAQIHDVNQRAFGRPVEADLVDVLREQARPFLSIVADGDGAIVGHICFTPVTIESRSDEDTRGTTQTNGLVMGLAPMAVAPERQHQGIGSQLVRFGLDECRRLGAVAVVVLGHPEYYPRFGFRPASSVGLRSEYDVPDPVFMVLALTPGVDLRGVARYHEAFAGIE